VRTNLQDGVAAGTVVQSLDVLELFFCWSVAVFVAVSSCATWVKNDT
jgi:hypothetical protein